MKAAYQEATGPEKAELSSHFARVIDSLVMKNGVKKTTYPGRQASILAALLGDERSMPKKAAIKVLDIPSSAGTASLDFIALLRQRYARCMYVMADLYWRILYDRERECVFDEDGTLLQVKLRRTFFSIYRAHCRGDAYNGCTALLLSPLALASRYLKRRYRYRADSHYASILLLHPEVERRLAEGELSLRRMDVFEPIADRFDLIISFNLVQRNYFSRRQIEVGVKNLANALEEGGSLIMGSTDAYSVSRKVNAELRVVKSEGTF